jgi:hypothetical protein
MSRPAAPSRAAVLAGVVALALAGDLALLAAAVHDGVAINLRFATLRVHDPSRPIAVAALLAGALIALGWRRARAAALTAFVAAGAAASAIIASAGVRAYPISDIALVELYTRAALAGHLLVGPYSRFGWHHPGPAYFYLLAPLYAIGGRNTAALCAGALVLSLTAVALTAWTTAKHAGAISSVAILAVTAACVWRVDQLIDSPWNAHVVVLPAISLIAGGAALAGGAIAALPAAVFGAIVVGQTDVALVPYATAILGLGVAAAFVMDRRARRADRRWAVTLNATAWVLALTCFLPAAEAVAHPPGNVVALVRFFAAPQEGNSRVDAIAAWADGLTAALRPGFTLAYGRSIAPTLSASHVWLAVMLVIGSIGAAVWAFRLRRIGLAWLGLMAAAGSLVTLWSATRVGGGFNDHFVFWFAGVGLVDAAVIVSAAGEVIGGAIADAGLLVEMMSPAVHGALLAAVLMVGLFQIDRARQGSFPVTVSLPSISTFDDSIAEYLGREHVRRPLFRIAGERWDIAVGMLQELDRRGIRFAIEDDWNLMFPDQFHASGDEDAELTVTGALEAPELAARAGNVTIDRSSRARVEAIVIGPARHDPR